MEHLHQVLGVKVRERRERGYPREEFPAITEIPDPAPDSGGSAAAVKISDMLDEEVLVTNELDAATG